jgi:hypothetical protein
MQKWKSIQKNFENARNIKSASKICRHDLLLGHKNIYPKNVLEENNTVHSDTDVIVRCKAFPRYITKQYVKMLSL